MRRILLILSIVLFAGCTTNNKDFELTKSSNFDFLLTVSKQDSSLDWWYKIPSNSGPSITETKEVFLQEEFSIYIIFSGYEIINDHVDIDFSFEILDPEGIKLQNNDSLIEAYDGNWTNPDELIFTRNFPIIRLPKTMNTGKYTIIVTGIDNNNGNKKTKNYEFFVTKPDITKTFKDANEKNNWVMNYYKNPQPEYLFAAAISDIELSGEWFNKFQNIMYIYSSIYKDNPYLSTELLKIIDTYNQEQQLKLLLLSIVSKDDTLIDFAKSKGWQKTIDFFKSLELLTPEEAYNDSMIEYLDLYWADFFLTGRIEPIKKILSTAKYMEYIGTLEDLQNNKIEKNDETIIFVKYESMLKTAMWSLDSNANTDPIIKKYLEYLYFNEILTVNEKFIIEHLLPIE